MRRIKKLFILLFVCAIMITLFASFNNAHALTSDEFIYHIVTTPSEDCSNSVMVNYHCKDSGSYVLYTLKSDTEFKNALKAIPTEELWSTEGMKNVSETSGFYQKRYVCNVELTGLDERTSYIYKIVDGEHESKVNSFTTAGLTNTWNFAAYADYQYRMNTMTAKLINNMKDICGNPALMVFSGDFVDVADNEYEFTHILDDESFSNFIFAASPGDHEYWGDEEKNHPQWDFPYTYCKLFHNPQNGASTSLNSSYYFIFNNVLFISLDCNNSDVSSGSRFTDQVKWFKQVIQDMEGKYQYSVVLMHKSIYGSAENDSSVSKNMRPQWYPVFSDANVDLVLSGHDHMYSRTYRLYNNKKSNDTTKGTYYLDQGSSGDKMRNPDSTLVEGGSLHEKVIDLKKLNYSVASNIEVSDTEMKVTVYNQYKRVVDEFTIKARRDAKSISASDFNEEDIKKSIDFKAVNFASGISELKISASNSSKYIQHIQLLNNENVVLDKNFNNSGEEDYLIRDTSGDKFTLKLTLIDGDIKEIPITLNICNDNDIRYEYNPFKISLRNDEILNFLKENNYKFDLYVEEEKVLENKSFSEDIIIDNKYYEADHKIRLDVYKDNNYVGSYNIETTKMSDIKLPEEDIIININQISLLEIKHKYRSLIICESDLIEYDPVNEVIKGIKAGEEEVTFRIDGTDIKASIKITVVDPHANQAKGGCNSKAAFVSLMNYLAIAFFIFFKRKH